MFFGTPNALAHASFALWVIVTLMVFSRFRAPHATVICILGGTLFLPEVLAIDPPLLPPIKKASVTMFMAWIGCRWKAKDRLAEAKPLAGIDILFLIVLFGDVGTVFTNMDQLVDGPSVRPGHKPTELIGMFVKDWLFYYLAFFLGRAMLRDRQDLEDLTRMTVYGGIAYALGALIEVRMSPQLHNWIYGYHPGDFTMTARYGGYRPTVFMATGMAVAMFILSATLISFARSSLKKTPGYISWFLLVVLVLCKSTGALVYAAFTVPLVATVKKPKLRLQVVLSTMVLFYPVLRMTNVFPVDELVETAEKLDEERAESLWFRFDQEAQLVARAFERPAFGWGVWDRNRIFDSETGEDTSTTDGDWAIRVGTRGLVGFFGLYGMLVIPMYVAARRIRKIPSAEDQRLLGGVAMVTALWTVDLLPNGLFHALPFFYAGATYGLSKGLLNPQRGDAPGPARGRGGPGGHGGGPEVTFQRHPTPSQPHFHDPTSWPPPPR